MHTHTLYYLVSNTHLEWGGLYVDSGNELWQLFLKNATYETFGVAGFDYILNILGMVSNCCQMTSERLCAGVCLW